MAASNYQACIAFTLKWEGGKSNDPHDSGGRTMEGVTQRRYDEFRDAKQLSRRTVFQMMPAERDEIYRSGYWEPVNGDALTAGVDLTLFDYAFNSGPARALRAWRLAKANGASAEAIIQKLCGERLSFLHSLGNWRYFGAGWGRRVAACEALAIKMACGKEAPEVLGKKAREATSRSTKHIVKAGVGGIAAAGAEGGHYFAISDAKVMIVLAAVVLVSIGIIAFQAWRQGQRAAAFKAAARS